MNEPTDAIDSAVTPAARRRRSLRLVLVLLAILVLAGWAVRRVWLVWKDDPERLWSQAQAAWSSGRLEEAEAALARLARGRPAGVAERLLRAEVARKRGRIDEALSALEGFPATGPGAAVIERTRGMLELERDRARPAEAALLRALSLDPKLNEARHDLINLYSIQSRRAELAAQFEALAVSRTLTFDELYLWCLGRRTDAGPAEFAARLERMVHNDPEDRPSRLALAEDLRRQGRLDAAQAALDPLSAADAEARAIRARLALDRGRADVAASLLADGPSDHPALARLRGRLALARGDASAVAAYRRALASEPDDRDTLFGLGQALRVAGETDAGQPYLRAARNRDRLDWLVENARSLSRRDDAGSLRAIGDACQSIQKLAEARAWYRLALARDPLDSELQKRLFGLDGAIGSDASRRHRRSPSD
jgi:tetratricopeptide (TPR) repeat protein